MSVQILYARDHAPGGLFKFFPYDDAFRQGWAEDLLLGRAYFSRLPDFNDPFEGKVRLEANPDTFAEEVAKFYKKKARNTGLSRARRIEGAARARRNIGQDPQRAIETVNRNHQERLDTQVRVWCASGTRAAPLLWSHYGHKHSGICVHLDTRQHPFNIALKVTYAADFPSVPMVVERGERDAEQLLVASLLTKAEFWVYEDEYRLVSVRWDNEAWDLGLAWNQDQTVAAINPGAVTGVTLGQRMPKAARERLLTFLRDNRPDIKVEEATLVVGRYELAFAESQAAL